MISEYLLITFWHNNVRSPICSVIFKLILYNLLNHIIIIFWILFSIIYMSYSNNIIIVIIKENIIVLIISFLQLYWTGCGMWFLVMDVCSIQTSGIWRHNVYNITKAKINFSTLVPSYNSSSLLLVLIFRTCCICEMVYGVKLFCAFHNV